MLSWFFLLATFSLCARASKELAIAILRKTTEKCYLDLLKYESMYHDRKVFYDKLCPVDSIIRYLSFGNDYLKFRWTNTQAYIRADIIVTNLKNLTHDQMCELDLLCKLEEESEYTPSARLIETVNEVGIRSNLRFSRVHSLNGVLLSLKDSELFHPH